MLLAQDSRPRRSFGKEVSLSPGESHDWTDAISACTTLEELRAVGAKIRKYFAIKSNRAAAQRGALDRLRDAYAERRGQLLRRQGKQVVLSRAEAARLLGAVAGIVTRPELDAKTKFIWRVYGRDANRSINAAELEQIRMRIEAQRAILDRNDPR